MNENYESKQKILIKKKITLKFVTTGIFMSAIFKIQAVAALFLTVV